MILKNNLLNLINKCKETFKHRDYNILKDVFKKQNYKQIK